MGMRTTASVEGQSAVVRGGQSGDEHQMLNPAGVSHVKAWLWSRGVSSEAMRDQKFPRGGSSWGREPIVPRSRSSAFCPARSRLVPRGGR